MSSLIIQFYRIIDKVSLIISSYTLIELINISKGVLPIFENSTIKQIAVLLPVVWYIFLFVKAIYSRKEERKQKKLTTENLEIENEIKKAMLLKVKEGNIDEIINELEERQKEMINNNKDD